MASILEKYKEEIKDNKFTGYIKTPSDLTPYSIGAGNGVTADTRLADEPAIKALEAKAPYTRYGGGTLAAGANDAKQEYSKRINPNG